MSIKPQGEFTLAPVIRLATGRSDAGVKQHRYWLRRNGELSREQPLLPWKSTCLIVIADEPDEPVGMSFEATLPVRDTQWKVGITGDATFECPQSEVHRLVTRWMQTRDGPKDPDSTFREDFSKGLERAAAACTEHAIADADGVAGAGEMGEELSKFLLTHWGLRSSLRFELKGKEALKRKDIPFEARVRLTDYEDDIPVTAVVELLPDAASPSPLRALAALGREDELGALFVEELSDFYSTRVGVDQLSDQTERNVWRPNLEKRIEACAASFGRRARLVKLVEVRPSMPGDADEVIRVTLADFQLPGEEPIEISLLVKLRLTCRSDLIRAMASKPGVPFNTEFERIARSILGPMAAGWSAGDLLRDNRATIEEKLSASLSGWARRYGYEAVPCTLTTTLDRTLPREVTEVLWRGHVRTAETDVTVDVEVIVELAFRAGVRAGQTIRTILDPIARSASETIAEIVGRRKPSDVYRHWAVPFPDGSPPLQEGIRERIVGLLKVHADDPTVTLKLQGQIEFVQMYDTLLRSSIDCQGVQLNPEKVPSEVTVDLHAVVVGLQERAWGEMATRRSMGSQGWNPVALASDYVPSLLQSAFAAVLESQKGTRSSKEQTIEQLGQYVTRQIRERFAIEVRPEIKIYSAPDILDFFHRLAADRRASMSRYFERRAFISTAIHDKRTQRIELISEGNGRHAAMEEVEDSLAQLQTEFDECEQETEVLQREYADAIYYIRLLSTPSDGQVGARTEAPRIEAAQGDARLGTA